MNSLLKDVTYHNLWLDIGQRTLTKCTLEMKENEKLLAGSDEIGVIRLDDVDKSVRTIQTVMWLTEVEQEPVSHVGDTPDVAACENLTRNVHLRKFHNILFL